MLLATGGEGYRRLIFQSDIPEKKLCMPDIP